MTAAPKKIWAFHAGPMVGYFVGKDPCAGTNVAEYTRIDTAQAQIDEQVGWVKDLADTVTKHEARIARLEEALEWYAEQVAGCRKLGCVGDVARSKLDRDGGSKARAALKEPK